MYRLVFLSGRYEGKRLVVRQAVTLVGRDAECHLLLPDDDLLRPRHARFEERGTGVFLSSLSPDQPVERNGEPVRESIRLAHNDLLLIGQTRIQFQDIIAPHARLRPSSGLMQPATLLMVAAILLLELMLLTFLVDWPRHLIRPETETADLARAEQIRAAREAEKNSQTGAVAKTDAPASVVDLPGTRLASDAPASTNAPDSATPPPDAPLHDVLDEADFAPADTNTPLVELPPVSAADPRLEKAQRKLAEAVSAAEFADYAKASRLLNQIHQENPGFLPAHVEHARLLEARGDLDAAQQRWTQILGLAPASSPSHAQALKERQRLSQIRSLQSQILLPSPSPDLSALPRGIRILAPDVQKMPSDADIAEMRVLNATLELAPDEKLFQDAAVQVFITFYDIDSTGRVLPSRAITTPSPIVLGKAFDDRRSIPLEATYVIPRGTKDLSDPASFYGYTLHVYAGQVLQDATAKPKKLLDLPIHLPSP